MKILHMVADIAPRSGGPTRSIKGLCRCLSNHSVDITLFVHSPEHPFHNPGTVRFRKGRGLDLRTIRKDAEAVIDEVRPDIVHLHGLWMLANHIDARVCRRMNVPYVIAPRGMLEPWSLRAKKWKKRLALWLYQRRDLKRAVALHATAESEAEQFRALGFKQPIIISPNGVDLPETMPERTMREDGKRTILFLSRIHPKKGLLELVEAWHLLRPSSGRNDEFKNGNRDGAGRICSRANIPLSSAWHVEYAGPDYGGHLHAVQKRIRELGVDEDFTYLGDLNDQDKWGAYRRADLFVLPTYSENFGIVVAEALAAGVTVITTKGAPWAELEGACVGTCDTTCGVAASGRVKVGSGRCGWWIDIGVEPLAEALKEAMGLSDEERREMGENGGRLVAAKYTWPAIAEQMKAAYAWILEGGDTPPYVRL